MPAYTRFAETWLVGLFEADVAQPEDGPNDIRLMTEADGGVWNEAAEQGTSGKVVIIRHQNTGRPLFLENALLTFNDDRVYILLVYLVTMVGENHTFEDLGDGAARLDDLLHKASGAVDGANILWCRWLAEHKEKVPEGDQFYPELGHYYEIAIQPT
jgi:hypothetical protein